MEDSYDFEKLRKKPKRKNSKAKGSAFERKVAKILNEHFETPDFQRSPGSGAYATTHNLPDHLKIYGDLITPKNFIYTIECKKGYNDLDRRDIIALIKQDSHISNQLKLNKKRIIYILHDYILVSLKDILSIDNSLFFN